MSHSAAARKLGWTAPLAIAGVAHMFACWSSRPSRISRDSACFTAPMQACLMVHMPEWMPYHLPPDSPPPPPPAAPAAAAPPPPPFMPFILPLKLFKPLLFVPIPPFMPPAAAAAAAAAAPPVEPGAQLPPVAAAAAAAAASLAAAAAAAAAAPPPVAAAAAAAAF